MHLLALVVCIAVLCGATASTVPANRVAEITLTAAKTSANPFAELTVDAVVTAPGGAQSRVPAFWAGGNQWRFRYSSPIEGTHTYRTECSDHSDHGLDGRTGKIEVVPYTGDNALYSHGPIRVAADHRHFEHADGTPFLWLGDTWWKGLAKRLTWDGFRRLTADRKAKGFSVVQIVCGAYPDEGAFEPRWENEGGKPYKTRDFRVINPAYFDYADRRIEHLVEAGIVPAIVGGWGRSDCDVMRLAGVEGMKRHWRYLVARYGAYPTVWIIGGEAGGPQWTEVAKYVQQIDPRHRPVTMHPGQSARDAVTDDTAVTFDMLQTGHGGWDAALGAIPKLRAAYSRAPAMPALIGEFCYEGHMQSAYQDIERYVFWGSMLSGAAGLTYGAAGVWHASVEGDPGITPVYDYTTWQEGMGYPGSTQLGIGKRLLEQYPWSRFQPHPEWTEPDSFAAGIPGEVRFIYQPRRGVYNWGGAVAKHIEPNVPYHAFYVNPCNGKRFNEGTFVSAGPPRMPFEGLPQPLLYSDTFQGPDGSAWKDRGTPTRRQDGHLIGGKGMLTTLERVNEADLMASVEARSDAEAGLVFRYQSPDRYVVALYSPLLKAIYVHDRTNGAWGEQLGRVDVTEIGPKIRLTAAVCGDCAAVVLTDGQKTYWTPVVKIGNVASGEAGLWLYQIGDRQEYGDFKLSKVPAGLFSREVSGMSHPVVWSDEYHAPNVPSPQDWVLVLERVR